MFEKMSPSALPNSLTACTWGANVLAMVSPARPKALPTAEIESFIRLVDSAQDSASRGEASSQNFLRPLPALSTAPPRCLPIVSLIGRMESEKLLTFSDHLGPIVSASFVIVSRNDVPNPPKMFLIFSNGPLAPVAKPKIDPKTFEMASPNGLKTLYVAVLIVSMNSPIGFNTASMTTLRPSKIGVIVTSATAYIQSASFWNLSTIQSRTLPRLPRMSVPPSICPNQSLKTETMSPTFAAIKIIGLMKIPARITPILNAATPIWTIAEANPMRTSRTGEINSPAILKTLPRLLAKSSDIISHCEIE